MTAIVSMNRLALTLFLWISTTAGGEIRFSRDIRPILSENCYYCHGQDGGKRKADLRLDDRESAIASGVLLPGESDASELISRITSKDPDVRMPPPESHRVLTEDQKELLTRWIAEGAQYEDHWAFVAPSRPKEPEVKNPEWIRNPIDAFVLAKLESLGLKPSAEADRETLIKRIHIDLIGLPPTPDEIEGFVNDTRPGAYDRLVDRMMTSKHYGERMALPWLDAARYADSNGFQQDGDTWQWLWRDWLVRALNEDLPFDEFTLWQLAGDLLTNPSVDQLIASGFNRNHLLNGEGGAIPEEQRFVILFDRMDTTATTWLGLTMACAQCHDHKYDPITQWDYYSLMDAFNRVPERGTPQRQSVRIRVAEPFLELPTEENLKRIAELEQKIAALESSSDRTEEELEKVKKRLSDYKGDQIPRPMIMSDARPRDTHVLNRGQYLDPLEKVTFNTPSFLPPMPKDEPKNRLGLARWLVSSEQPLTARVQVNRIWQHYFGTGIVKTSEDFGKQSEYPTHLDLLDWLAVEFRESGWSMKHIHRLIVTSSTYRQSSRLNDWHKEYDLENRLYARAGRFRMPSMILRDWALETAGLLVNQLGGPPVYPYQPENVWEALAITKERDFTYPTSTGSALYRRSLYTFWRRTVAPTNMFDTSNRQTCRVRQSVTSTPLHALTTLNDPTWVEAARVLAERCMRNQNDPDTQLSEAFYRVLCRRPTEENLELLRVSYERQFGFYRDNTAAANEFLSVGSAPRDLSLDTLRHASLTAVCLGILNLDEALSRQ